ncbi:hypothetical protein [Candidatus Formimonas warabiya]|uniref:Diaminopimelate epimerase n=1 Tax=Formimonas warabiya TaxID=1761012 RepID=A0A3G1KZN2_FORW1|nr:hypothetical protein [Candidatus Formimonas warabiya]ATW27695.1 hypothetical protein DCMF_25690 [Candidatus Formimonas warabiya]
MKLNFVKLSPAKNTTVLITDYVDPVFYQEIARVVMRYEYLGAEQVGFIVPPRNKNSRLRLEMSGSEFCGNAVLSAAALGIYKGLCREDHFCIESSGTALPLSCEVIVRAKNLSRMKAEMPKPDKMEQLKIDTGEKEIPGCLVQLPGISHFVTNCDLPRESYDQVMEILQSKSDAKALGIISYRELGGEKYEIFPFVFVRDSGSKVFEQACGSGSLSLGAYLHATEGKSILEVQQPGGTITVETGVKDYLTADVFFTCEGLVDIAENR